MSELNNRLGNEGSPYLRSHAGDPVEWQPWGDEAFEMAQQLERPVFLSIGYDSCHWCHVMQRESFRDEATAAILNERFVPIKVDRELRPDVDHVYMTYVNLATGHGGWPMSVFLTPERRPFFGGTYFPPEAVPGMPSFADVLAGVSDAWAGDRESVSAVAAEAVEMVDGAMRPRSTHALDATFVADAANAIARSADRVNGGLGGAPKFPQLPTLGFLYAYARASEDAEIASVADAWLRALLRGGIYDHVAGGLFRYSTDAEWLVPHFEKMLYDNGLLLGVLACAYRREADAEIATAIRQTAAFLSRDLSSPEGGYISSLDADTGGVEGGTYVWSYDELASGLSPDELAVATEHLGVVPGGNWEGAVVLERRGGRAAAAESVDAVLERLAELRAVRQQPKRIDNRLTEWNAYAARGLIEAGESIGDAAIVDQGLEVARWIADVAVEGRVVAHAAGEPPARAPGLLADYAATASAFLAAAPHDASLGDLAPVLVREAFERFGDGELLFMGDGAGLPSRPIAYDDAPEPSGAATLVACHARLHIDDMSGLRELLSPATGVASRAPAMAGEWLRVMLGVTGPAF